MTLENRTYKNFDLVSLPIQREEWIPNQNPEICSCEPYLVCASNDTEDWKQDITSAWIKLYSNSDSYEFVLTKDGINSTYQPTVYSFVNDSKSKYAVINWSDCFNSDGYGCYKLTINYTISGVSDSIIWGEYRLVEFSSLQVEKTIRLKAIFNSNQTIENIDFTNSKVIDTFRFKGYFGDRQTNTEIDNLIYSNREMKKVTRENLNKYTLYTYPLKYNGYIDRLTDLYLLSENELYISDFNSTNPTYNYLNTPVIVSESPKLDYQDGIRKVKLTCNFDDKVKNSRSYY